MIKGIIFDCYGVLVHGSLDYLRLLVSGEQRQAVDDAAQAFDRGMVSLDEYTAKLAELLERSVQDIEAIIAHQELKSEVMLEYVRSFREGYKTALLSNIGRGSIERLFTADELRKLFDVVVLSGEIGVTKPSKEAYEAAVRGLGLEPAECIMIDDSEANVEGACRAGLQAVLFKDKEQCEADIRALLGSAHA